MRRKLTLMLAVLLAASFLAGCSWRKETAGYDQEKKFTIGVVTKSRDSEYWMSVCSGMEKAASDLDVSVIIMSPETEMDEDVQNKMLDGLLKKDIQALAVSPIDSYNTRKYLEKAKAKGIPVYSYDTRIVSGDIPYVGIDNEKVGKGLAEYLTRQLQPGAKIGIITGSLNQSAHKMRLRGFQEYIEQNSDMEIAFVESGYSNLQMSEREISRLMSEHPDISGIFATSAVTALGIMDYLKDRPVLIATVDAQEDAIEAVRNGGIAALACQSGYDIGYEAVKYITEAKGEINGKQKDRILDIEIITKENADDYQASGKR